MSRSSASRYWRIGLLPSQTSHRRWAKRRGSSVAEHGLQFGGRPFAPAAREARRQASSVGQQVQAQVVAGLPVGGDLQDRRAADAAMGDQHVGTEARAVAAALDRQGDAAQVVAGAPGACRSGSAAPVRRAWAARRGRTGGRARSRSRSHPCSESTARQWRRRGQGIERARALVSMRNPPSVALHACDAAAGLDAHAGLGAFVQQHGHDLLGRHRRRTAGRVPSRARRCRGDRPWR